MRAPSGGAFVLKRLRGDSARERWYERLRGRPPRSPARRECENLAALRADGLPVPRPLAWLEQPAAPGRSAVAMEFVEHRQTLRARLAEAGPDERARWLERLLELSLRLHGRGWYHRDYYLEHLVLPTRREEGPLVLLDAGRARREARPRRRWFVKDLAALLSSAPPAVTRAERLRFLARWLEGTGHGGRASSDARGARRAWARRVLAKARRLAAHAPRFEDRLTPEVPPPLDGTGAAGERRPIASAPRGPTLGHLVVRAPNWVGDLVMATPVLEAAVADPRWSRVTIAVRGHLAAVLEDGPCAPHVLPLSREVPEVRALTRLGADAALLLSNSFGAAWRAFRARIPVRAGVALGGRRPLLTHAVVPPTRDGRRVPVPMPHVHRDVAGLLGIVTPDLHPRLAVGEACRRRAAELLAGAGLAPGEPYVLCCPGAAFGGAKLWPPERFAAALDRLAETRGLRPLVTGGPGEEGLVAAVAAASRRGARALPVLPDGLAVLKALVAGAQLLVVGDSGPRFYAAALDVPCVTVLGPTFLELTRGTEWCEPVRVPDLDCAPCVRRRCPLGHHRCMRELEPEWVVAAAERLLDRREALEPAP